MLSIADSGLLKLHYAILEIWGQGKLVALDPCIFCNEMKATVFIWKVHTDEYEYITLATQTLLQVEF